MIYACSVLWKHGNVFIFAYVIGVEIDRHMFFLASPRATACDAALHIKSKPRVDHRHAVLQESAIRLGGVARTAAPSEAGEPSSVNA